MIDYLPIVFLVGISLAFVVVMILVSLVVGPRSHSRVKYDRYECGVDPTPMPVDGGRVPVRYYVIAMLFIVFDIEVVFLYPWAVTFNQLGVFALIEMLLFTATCFIAYVYVWRRGGLDWD